MRSSGVTVLPRDPVLTRGLASRGQDHPSMAECAFESKQQRTTTTMARCESDIVAKSVSLKYQSSEGRGTRDEGQGRDEGEGDEEASLVNAHSLTHSLTH